MPRKRSGEIKTVTVRQTQKNGDVYVHERQIVYDPDTKNNTILNSKLIGKIPKGADKMVPTRPKRTILCLNGKNRPVSHCPGF